MRETLLRVERLLRRPLSHTGGAANDSSVNETYFAGGYGPVSEGLLCNVWVRASYGEASS
jgi:hypothetical protein